MDYKAYERRAQYYETDQMGVVHHLSGAVQKYEQDYGFTQNLRR